MKFLTVIAVVVVLAAFFFKPKVEKTPEHQENPSTYSAEVSQDKAAVATTAEPKAAPVEAPAPAAVAYNYGPPTKPAGWIAPTDIKVQHILISFQGAAGGGRLANKSPRTQERALELCQELVKRLRDGEAMAPLVKQYSQDRPPGIYEMTTGSPRHRKIIPKGGMVKFFGDVSFALDVGEVGLAEYHASHSPYGYHIVKRLQ